MEIEQLALLMHRDMQSATFDFQDTLLNLVNVKRLLSKFYEMPVRMTFYAMPC